MKNESQGLLIKNGDYVKEVRVALNDDGFPRITFVLDRSGKEYIQNFDSIVPHGCDDLKPAGLVGLTVENVKIIEVGVKVEFFGGMWFVHAFKPINVSDAVFDT